MNYTKILGTGSYLPERVMLNSELEAMVDTSDEWIQARTGIKERHIAREDETTCDMCEQAALNAIQAADIDPSEIDLIVLATSTPDLIYPSTACLLQARLGVSNTCAAFDVQAACSGFVYAFSIAEKFIQSGSVKKALVVGADANSKILDWTDRGTCVLFGDGAGAIILEASDEPGVYATRLHADGSHAHLLQVPSGVSKPTGDPFIRMSGNEVFKFAVNAMGSIVDETLQECGLSKSDIDWLVPHQANQRIIKATARKLGVTMDKVILTVAEHGNTSGGSIPLALDTGIRDGRIKRGDKLFLEAVGSGFTWGSIVLKY
ncbi:MAG: beta-ketoacyl-ACP synthase III [Gammaproteobacteria bacterium]|nr:beta-ketoacyl-ACP synthase III [Gammaproteobacteria bacterium]